jgi:hypothetical protein
MDVVITEWALQSYLDLKKNNVFTPNDYKTILRPDVERLKGGLPSQDPKFKLSSFWGPVTDRGKKLVQHAFKMKWDSLGPGRVELRLIVVHWADEALLCQAYVKSDSKVDLREMAKAKDRVNLIANGQYHRRGII